MNTDTITPLSDFLAQYPKQAFCLGNSIDRDTALSATCEHCEHKGLYFHAWRSNGSYIVVAECPKCRHAFEF